MREIKFRVWDLQGKCWLPQAQLAVAAFYGHKDILTYQAEEDRWIAETISFAVMQYTGVKDKNGREIYEGDIILYPWATGDYSKAIIEYRTPQWASPGFTAKTIWHDQDDSGLDIQFDSRAEVIGNIYENPELASNSTLTMQCQIHRLNACIDREIQISCIKNKKCWKKG